MKAALAAYLKSADLPVPKVTVLPGDVGLVQLPVIAYSESVATQTLTKDVGVPATITAVPHWTWDFGDPEVDPNESS